MHWIRHHEFEVVREYGEVRHTHRGRAARGRPCPGFGITTEFHANSLPEDRRRSEQAIMNEGQRSNQANRIRRLAAEPHSRKSSSVSPSLQTGDGDHRGPSLAILRLTWIPSPRAL